MAAFDKYEIKDLFKDTGVLPPSKFMNLIDGLWRPNLWLYNEQLLSETDLEKVNPEDENYDARYLYEPNSFLTAGDEDIYSWSQAYGYGHVVRANFAQVFGHANQANGMFETVMGSYATKSEAQTAKEWVVTDRLWTLGNGYDDDNRSDALTIYKSGFGVWDNAIAIGLYSHGGVEPIDGSIQFLLDSSEGYLQVYYNSQWNNLTIGSHTAVEKFIELSDCPSNYADRYALISDLENEQIIYSTVHGAAPKWFFVDQGCPNPSWDPEILINGDFSEGDTGWTVPAGWSTATGAAVHTPGSTGALTQEVEGSTLSGTYKLEIVTSGIIAGTITITVHDAATDAQLGETYVIGASNQGDGICLFELAARDNYLIKITPSTTFNGTVDDCSFKKGDLNSSVPQIRGYTFNHTNVSPFEVAWRNDDLYIGRNAGWHGGLGVGGVVAVTPDGMTTVTGGYNITALGHTVGNGITNEHDLILIGTGVTVDTEQSNWLKIGIGSNEILEGDLSNLDLFPKGNLKVYKNLTLWSGNTYDYTFPEPITLNIGRFMYVSKATPAGELNWSVYSFPTSLPDASSVPLISEAGVGTWLAESNLAKWSGLTSGYVPYYDGSALANSVIYNDAVNSRIGIGTTSPGAKLDVNNKLDQVGFNTGTALTNGASRVGRSLPALVWAYSGVAIFGGIDMVRGSGSSGDMRFYANPSVSAAPTEVMRLSGSTGNVGIGTTTPTSLLHLAAGSATRAPLAFTSGTLTTGAAIKAGQMEFLDDRFYGTITTGAARKQFAFLEDNLTSFSSGAATSGHVPTANGSGGITWAAAAGSGSKWVYDAVEQDLTYTETLGYGHVGINVTDPLFCLDIEESFRVDDGRGFHFRFDMQGAFIIQPATYIRNSSLFEIQQLHATESGRLLVMKQHAEGDYLSLWKYNGSTYVQKFKINHLGVMTSSGVTYPSAVPSANGQTIIGNTDGSTSWGTPSATVPGEETLTYGATVTINWNGNTTAKLVLTGPCALSFGTPANYTKRVYVTGNYSLTVPVGTIVKGDSYDGTKKNLLQFFSVDGQMYCSILNG